MGDERQTSREQGNQSGGTQEQSGPQPVMGKFLGWDMMIVPDDYKGTLPSTNWIYQKYKTEYERLYSQVEGGSTNIKISEETGTAHGHASNTTFSGFRDKVLKAIKRMMTTKTGRKLIKELASGGFDVTIRPSNVHVAGTARDNNTAASDGTGTGSTVYMDPNLSDTSFKAFDKDGNELASPVFMILGHELIHARHNQEGTNARGTASADFGNMEEENTIRDRTGLTENAMRREHGLGVRHGHGARDTGDRSATVSGGAAGG